MVRYCWRITNPARVEDTNVAAECSNAIEVPFLARTPPVKLWTIELSEMKLFPHYYRS